MRYPTITATHGTFTCRFPVPDPGVKMRVAFMPFGGAVVEEDPGWFSPELLAACQASAAQAAE